MTAPLLLISATPDEAAPTRARLGGTAVAAAWGEGAQGRLGGSQVVVLALGVGKTNTAAGLALAIERWRPRAVVQLGIGGAFVGSFLSNGMVAVASAEVHVDTGAGEDETWLDMEALGLPVLAGPPPRYNEMPIDRELSERLAASSRAPLVRFATSERVTADLDAAARLHARFDVAIESMEGAAAAQACLALGVPFAEIRAVSNIVGERDRRAWDVPGAIRAVNESVLASLREVLRVS